MFLVSFEGVSCNFTLLTKNAPRGAPKGKLPIPSSPRGARMTKIPQGRPWGIEKSPGGGGLRPQGKFKIPRGSGIFARYYNLGGSKDMEVGPPKGKRGRGGLWREVLYH